jgi:hypothetical protein
VSFATWEEPIFTLDEEQCPMEKQKGLKGETTGYGNA